MLGKLMKHEWRKVSKVGLLLGGIALAIAFLFLIYMITPLWRGTFDDYSTWYTEALGFMAVIFWILLGFAVVIGITLGYKIYIAVRYHKTMFTDEGYLLHTLPVKPIQLLVSKICVAVVWDILLSLWFILLICFLIVVGAMSATGKEFAYVMEELMRSVTQWFFDNKVTAIYNCLGLFVGPFFTYMILFGCQTIGSLSKRNKGLMGILVYFGVIVVRIIVYIFSAALINASMAQTAYAQSIPAYAESSAYDQSRSINYLVQFILQIIFAVVAFLWANYILNKKLDME